MSLRIDRLLALLAFATALAGCESEFTPRPRGYMHIELQPHSYAAFDTTCPFVFEMSAHARATYDPAHSEQPCWFSIEYPRHRAKVHISYARLNGDLATYLEDVRTLTNKHISKASGIQERVIMIPERDLFGMRFDVGGTSAASPIQFFITDSTTHFMRGALYFNAVPNNDSLAPVVQYISEDIDHLISTFRWKD
jgi:gliding motility-associated lipoprotein GldD